jgi:hypothetical protein
MSTKNSEQELREFAKKSLKKKRDFKQYLGVWAGVSALTTGIWAAAGAGYFWPIWVILGMGIGAFFAGLDAYGKSFNNPITEADIDAEVKRLSGK